MAKKKKYGRLAKALARVKHSPAGKKYLESQKKQTVPTYFKGKAFERKSIEQQLIDAGVNISKIKRMKGKK